MLCHANKKGRQNNLSGFWDNGSRTRYRDPWKFETSSDRKFVSALDWVAFDENVNNLIWTDSFMLKQSSSRWHWPPRQERRSSSRPKSHDLVKSLCKLVLDHIFWNWDVGGAVPWKQFTPPYKELFKTGKVCRAQILSALLGGSSPFPGCRQWYVISVVSRMLKRTS